MNNDDNCFVYEEKLPKIGDISIEDQIRIKEYFNQRYGLGMPDILDDVRKSVENKVNSSD